MVPNHFRFQGFGISSKNPDNLIFVVKLSTFPLLGAVPPRAGSESSRGRQVKRSPAPDLLQLQEDPRQHLLRVQTEEISRQGVYQYDIPRGE